MIGPNKKKTKPKGSIQTKKTRSKEVSSKKQGKKRKLLATNSKANAVESDKVMGNNKLRVVKKSKCLLKKGDSTEKVSYDAVEIHSLGDGGLKLSEVNPSLTPKEDMRSMDTSNCIRLMGIDFLDAPSQIVDENMPTNGSDRVQIQNYQNKSFIINSKKIDELIDEMESMAGGLNKETKGLSTESKEEEIVEEFLDISQCRIIHEEEGNFNLINEQELNSFTAEDYYDYILGYEHEEIATTTTVPAPTSVSDDSKTTPITDVATSQITTPSTNVASATAAGPDTGQKTESSDDFHHSNLSWLLNFKVASIFDPNSSSDTKSEEQKSQDTSDSESKKDGAKTKISDKTNQVTTKKPPFTYTELIDQALKEKGQLTVSNIYSWISERFPFYRPNDDRWKNSVRHNLSINPHFRKGSKAPHGAGHFWILSNSEAIIATPPTENQDKGNEQSYSQNEDYNWEEVLEATRNIEQVSNPEDFPLSPLRDGAGGEVISEADKRVEESSTACLLSPVLSARDPTLHQTAGDILNGIKKRVEVQYLQPLSQCQGKNSLSSMESPDEQDQSFFSSSILKEIDGSICLLERESDYLMSDLNETLFNEELNFQNYTLSSQLG